MVFSFHFLSPFEPFVCRMETTLLLQVGCYCQPITDMSMNGTNDTKEVQFVLLHLYEIFRSHTYSHTKGVNAVGMPLLVGNV